MLFWGAAASSKKNGFPFFCRQMESMMTTSWIQSERQQKF